MKPLKLLLLLCLMSCLECWSQAVYHVTVQGAGDHSGSTWANALDADEFSDMFDKSPSGTKFLMETGVYRPKEGKSGFSSDKAFVLEGGYKSVNGEMTRDLSTMTDDDMTVLLGDISTDPKQNKPISFIPESDGMDVSGIIFESSALEDFFVLNSTYSGGEIVMRKGVGRRPQNKPCEGSVDETYTETIVVGGMSNFGDDEVDITRDKIGTFSVIKEKVGADGCSSKYTYIVNVLPKPTKIDGKPHYYVKLGGKGDGSSWEKAMGDTAFAYSINRVEDGATFHIAEGVYHPIYDMNGALTTVNPNRMYYTNKAINLQGGYPANLSGDVKAQPDQFVAMLSGDLTNNMYAIDSAGKGSRNVHNILYCDLPDGGDIHLSGLAMKGTGSAFSLGSLPQTGDPALVGVKSLGEKATLTMEDCQLVNSNDGLRAKNCDVNLENCYFYDNFMGSSVVGDYLSIKKSSFENSYIDVSAEKCQVENSSYISKTIYTLYGLNIKKSGTTSLENNTFLTSVDITGCSSIAMTGNIFVDTIRKESDLIKLASSYNVYKENSSFSSFVSDNDIVLPSQEDFHMFLRTETKKVDGKDTVVFARETYRNGIPVIPMDEDHYGSVSLRFPLKEVSLTEDQMGNPRPDSTCVGAFEKGFPRITITLDDAVAIAGETFTDKQMGIDTVFTKIGDHEVEKRLEHGSLFVHDTIYTRHISVLPKSTKDGAGKPHYYVKFGGKGDGSSWGTAMGDTAFAYSINRVEDGATFHIAEGTYHPIYDINGVVPTNNNRKVFYTTKLINLIGGYDKDAAENAISDPKENETVFCGDIKGDDSGDYAKSENVNDDVYNIFVYNLSNPGSVHVDGMVFKHSWIYTGDSQFRHAHLAVSGNTSDVEFEVNNCTFSEGYTFLELNNCSSRINECYFKGAILQAIHSESGSVNVRSCTFDRGELQIINVANLDTLGIVNSTFYGDTSAYAAGISLQYAVKEFMLVNNTIVVPVTISDQVEKAEIIGNIFGSALNLEAKSVKTSGNVYATHKKTFAGFSSTDKPATMADLMSILDNKQNEYVLKNNGGFTPTIGLISDMMGSTSIRFDRVGLTTVTTDQCGNSRPDSTCAGSLEKSFTHIVPPTTDTLTTEISTLAGSYVNKRFGIDTTLSIGSHEIVVANATADTVYVCQFEVLPNGTKDKDNHFQYYVKVDGNGDGSSWDNAMSGAAFAYSIGKVDDNSTFYIAEGVYHPVYDMEGKPMNTKLGNGVFFTTKLINLQGGYPKNASGNVMARPDTFRAVLSGDLGSNTYKSDYVARTGKKDVYDVLKYELKKGGNVRLSGIVLTGSKKDSLSGALLGVNALGDRVTFMMEDCELSNSYLGLMTSNCDVTVKNCFFYDNLMGSEIVGGVLSIECSSFDETYTKVSSEKCQVRNCTYISKTTEGVAGLQLGYSKKVESVVLENNTFLTGVSVEKFSSLTMTGNIFADTIKVVDAGSTMSSSYNIYRSEHLPNYRSDNDLAFSELDFRNFLRGRIVNKETKVTLEFVRETYRNGIPVIPMDTDYINGVSLRFPLSAVSVNVDQRGKIRPENTCIGAYETRVVSEPTPIVIPDLDKYYVKVGGNGDGSSWEKAMNNEYFQRSLLKSKRANVVYYIAEGEYEPLFDSVGNVPAEGEQMDIYFYSKNPVTLIGGFSNDAKPGDVTPDPASYSTVFRTAGNDQSLGNLFLFDLISAGNVSVSGINFVSTRTGGGAIVVNAYTSGSKLSMEACQVSSSSNGLVLNACSGAVKNSSFKDDSIGIVLNGNATCTLEVNASTFSGSETGIVSEGLSGEMNIYNSTFAGLGKAAINLGAAGASTCKLTNNSILGDVTISSTGKNVWLGNIIAGQIRRGDNATTPIGVVSSFNLYLQDDGGVNETTLAGKTDETDLWASRSELCNVLECSGNGSFDLKDNGGSTQTVAVVSDALSDSKTIRFRRENTSCGQDQRGIERLPLTCRGAFELAQYTSLTIPSAFTPYTQDGVNDRFMPGFEVYIYDRYGMLIAHSIDGWDGYYKGSLATPGVYAYVLIMPDAENRKGTIEILKTK